MKLFKKLFLHSPMHYGIALVSCIAFTICYIALRNFAFIHLPDGIKTAGLVIALIGLLLLCVFYGTFDTFGYAFSTFRKKDKRKYEDLVAYSKIKASERKLKELFFMPYITTGLLILVVGIITGLFIKPLPKLDAVKNLSVEVVEGEIELTFDRNELASNGYTVYYSENVITDNEEDLPETFSILVEQPTSNIVKVKIKVDDINKSYIFSVCCNHVEGSYNGSNYQEIIYSPNK